MKKILLKTRNKLISIVVYIFGAFSSEIRKNILKYNIKRKLKIVDITEIEFIEKFYRTDFKKMCLKENLDPKIQLINRLGEINEKRWYEFLIIPFLFYLSTVFSYKLLMEGYLLFTFIFIFTLTNYLVIGTYFFREKIGIKNYERIIIENKLKGWSY